MTVSIRPLQRGDRAQWEPLWLGYQKFYQVEIPQDVTEETWRRFFEEAEPVHGLGAYEGQRLRGITHYIFHRSTWMIPYSCYLQDLFVTPELRGKGIARKLIEAVYAAADKAGAGRVYWLTQENNYAARMLYDKVAKNYGFIQYRR
ncbi:MAG: GNAT family N-acetyltransferase [Hyphomicrobiaceae bacterium]|nr:MAG: GNAT family N-acetyltransferase [Hyphomicrobiaceae bacterium]